MHRAWFLIVVVALFAVACTGGGGETTSSTSVTSSSAGGTPTSTSTTVPTEPPDGFGGTVTIGIDTSIESLNPFAPNNFHGRLAGNAIWATVYDIDPVSWDRIPDVVAGLPSESGGIELNDDGTMTVRYEMASGARWSDGLPISGADLAFTADAMRDMAVAGTGGVDPVMATVVETDSVEQLAFITFAEPTLAFEDALWIVLPSHALEGVDLVGGTDGSDWPSGGPFMVGAFDPFTSVSFVRNPFYWKTDTGGKTLPFLDRLVFDETTEAGLQADEPVSPVADFLARERDVIDVPNWQPEIDKVAEAEPDGAVLESAATPIIEMLQFQFGPNREAVNPASLNDSSDFRRGVAHAFDRAGLLESTGVPWYPETPGMLVAQGTSAWEQYPYDPQAGSDLVAAVAGSEPAESVLSTTGNGDYRIRMGDAFTESFGDIGVTYEPSYLDSVLFFGEVLAQGAFDIGMWAWVNDGGYASQLGLLRTFDPSSEPPDGNYGRWGSSGLSESAQRFADIVDAAHRTVDPSEFEALVAEAEEILADLVITIPLFSRASHMAYWSDVVTGVSANGSQSTFTWNVEEWQRVGE